MPVKTLHPKLDSALRQPQAAPRCRRSAVRTQAVVAAPPRQKLVTDKSEQVLSPIMLCTPKATSRRELLVQQSTPPLSWRVAADICRGADAAARRRQLARARLQVRWRPAHHL